MTGNTNLCPSRSGNLNANGVGRFFLLGQSTVVAPDVRVNWVLAGCLVTSLPSAWTV
jgi:hypothetical protein